MDTTHLSEFVTSDCQGGITCTSWRWVTKQHQAMWWCHTQRNNGKRTWRASSKLESPGVKDNSHLRRWSRLKNFHSVCFGVNRGRRRSSSCLLKLRFLPCSDWETYRGETGQTRAEDWDSFVSLRVEGMKEAGPCRFLETRLCAGARSLPRHMQCTWGARRRARAESCRLLPQGRVDRCYWGDATAQVATPPTASEFRGGIIDVILRPMSGADFSCLITDEHLLQNYNSEYYNFLIFFLLLFFFLSHYYFFFLPPLFFVLSFVVYPYD